MNTPEVQEAIRVKDEQILSLQRQLAGSTPAYKDDEKELLIAELSRVITQEADFRRIKSENPYVKQLLTKTVMKITHNDGEYEGETIRGIPNGIGKISYKDGAKYEGEWLNGMRNGFGKFWHAGGEIYEGEFKNGEAYGFGKYYSVQAGTPGQNVLSGHFEDGVSKGFIIEEMGDGSIQFSFSEKGLTQGLVVKIASDKKSANIFTVKDNEQVGDAIDLEVPK